MTNALEDDEIAISEQVLLGRAYASKVDRGYFALGNANERISGHHRTWIDTEDDERIKRGHAVQADPPSERVLVLWERDFQEIRMQQSKESWDRCQRDGR